MRPGTITIATTGFTPRLRSECVGWFRPDANSITHVTGSISAFLDSSIQLRHLTQSLGSLMPTYAASDAAYNNRPTITFTATHYLDSSVFSALSPLWTVYVVGHASAVGNQVFVGNAIADPGNEKDAIYATAGNASTYGGAGPLVSSTALTSKHVICAIQGNAANSAIYVDDSTTAVITGSNGSASVMTYRLGAARPATGGLIGTIAEVVMVTGADTQAQRYQMMKFLGDYYGKAVT